MAIKDPYQILEVSRTASQDDIKNAYRSLAKKYHPDLNPGNQEAESRFKDISFAYERIGTPENRAKFDRGEFDEAAAAAGAGGFEGFGRAGHRGPFYRNTQDPGQGGGRYTFSFGGGGAGIDEDLFASIFGARAGAGRGPETGQVPGEDQLYQMEIELRDAVMGAEKEITLPSGKRLLVKIPKGIQDGARLRFAGQGAPGIQGGPSGDAYVVIHVRGDRRFERDGDDLVVELPISITEAVFGGVVRAPTISGEVLLKVPPKSNTGKKLKLAGKGIFNSRTGRSGDQIIILKVMLPETIDSDLENALRVWQTSHSYNPREREVA